MLKQKLGAFGWHEAVRRERKHARMPAPAAPAAGAAPGDTAADVLDYLERMGVSDSAIRQRIANALPVADLEQIAGGGAAAGAPLRPAELLRPLARPQTPGGGERPAPLVVVPDADASLGELSEALARVSRRAYALDLPPRRHLAKLRSVGDLAALLVGWCLDALSVPGLGAVIDELLICCV
jgi:hypothetical protein